MKNSKLLRSFTALGVTVTILAACSNGEEQTEAEKTDADVNAENETGEQENDSDSTAEQPKNVIMMIGDGLGLGQMEIARLLEYGKEGNLHMESLDHAALMRTYSADNWVTDSAAAGTAIATSTRTNNGMIGVDPDNQNAESILDIFSDEGKKVGLISNNTITDATPAAFAASVETRSGEEEIARQLYENEPDVMLGGGADNFTPERQDGDDLLQMFEEDKDYTVVTDRDELLEAESPERLLGLFHSSYMNYKTDINLYDSNEPSLNEMSEAAIDLLSENDEGFFLMIEGARIDHAAHAADFTNVWKETIEFDHTVADVLEWMEDLDDTLLVVLSDHETMGMSASEVMDKEALREVEASPEYMVQEFTFDEESGTYEEETVKDVVEKYSNVELTDEEVEKFNEYIYDEDGELRPLHQQAWEIGSFIADHYDAGVMNRDIRAYSDTGGHSGNMVPVFAEGAGADQFDGVLDITDISQIIAEISDLSSEPGTAN
ncbi:alkaline phosphatase [Geomicrobium halophilum]|uniref:Alkaline phosphatase n=1 Tax=Geomicrobium halophilum TaxID=549000 RepID=A0A841PZA6_9BACL|nr:alkaline phosphatase [Geomicrobium halophilum]MBB6449942.1 alkaline phosphatase [Geomicrobium halophilum]